jgi:hypothetical protein
MAIMANTKSQLRHERNPPRHFPSPRWAMRAALRRAVRSRANRPLSRPRPKPDNPRTGGHGPRVSAHHLRPARESPTPTHVHNRAASSTWVLARAAGFQRSANDGVTSRPALCSRLLPHLLLLGAEGPTESKGTTLRKKRPTCGRLPFAGPDATNATLKRVHRHGRRLGRTHSLPYLKLRCNSRGGVRRGGNRA